MVDKSFVVRNGLIVANLFISNTSVTTINTNTNITGILATYAGASVNGSLTVNGSITANGSLTVNGNLNITSINANNSLGTNGQTLFSNGSTVYWGEPASALTYLTANNTDSQTFYIGMSNNSSGQWTNVVVSTSKLYFVPSTGTLNATNYNTLSDKQFKKDIKTIQDPLEILKMIDGVEFNWKDNGNKSYGVIAQNIENVLPEIVEKNYNGIKTVNYQALIAFLIESVKRLNLELQNLKK